MQFCPGQKWTRKKHGPESIMEKYDKTGSVEDFTTV